MSEEERERVARGQAQTRPLTERIEEGTAHHEPVTVYFKDGKEHAVEVYALSTRQFRQAVRKSGLTARELQEIGTAFNEKKELSAEQGERAWDFFQELTAAAVREPADILDQLLPNEETKIVPKTLEMSRPPKNSPNS